jgi:hypothetical protein
MQRFAGLSAVLATLGHGCGTHVSKTARHAAPGSDVNWVIWGLLHDLGEGFGGVGVVVGVSGVLGFDGVSALTQV